MQYAYHTTSKALIALYHKTHWFSDQEGWAVYRFFAILEAIGWSLLIFAIGYRAFGLPEADSVISFMGRIHGIGFVLYFVAALIVARSMEWGLWRISGAIVAGMPPYGSIVFERVMAWHRRKYPPNVTPPKEPTD